jgi:hypothetical protein
LRFSDEKLQYFNNSSKARSDNKNTKKIDHPKFDCRISRLLRKKGTHPYNTTRRQPASDP